MKRRVLAQVIAGMTLIVGGGVLLLKSAHVQGNFLQGTPASATVSHSDTDSTSTVAPVNGIPVQLELPALAKDFPVKEGVYDETSRTWTLSSDAVYYANISQPVNNERGTTLIYGHAESQLFGGLTGLAYGDVAIVRTANAKKFYYQLTATKTVAPESTEEVFSSSGQPRLILQTCTGSWWQSRQLYIFDFKRVSA